MIEGLHSYSTLVRSTGTWLMTVLIPVSVSISTVSVRTVVSVIVSELTGFTTGEITHRLNLGSSSMVAAKSELSTPVMIKSDILVGSIVGSVLICSYSHSDFGYNLKSRRNSSMVTSFTSPVRVFFNLYPSTCISLIACSSNSFVVRTSTPSLNGRKSNMGRFIVLLYMAKAVINTAKTTVAIARI